MPPPRRGGGIISAMKLSMYETTAQWCVRLCPHLLAWPSGPPSVIPRTAFVPEHVVTPLLLVTAPFCCLRIKQLTMFAASVYERRSFNVGVRDNSSATPRSFPMFVRFLGSTVVVDGAFNKVPLVQHPWQTSGFNDLQKSVFNDLGLQRCGLIDPPTFVRR